MAGCLVVCMVMFYSCPVLLFQAVIGSGCYCCLCVFQSILQIAGATVDLLDVQGSSVMFCLEDGWDFSTQVMCITGQTFFKHNRLVSQL